MRILRGKADGSGPSLKLLNQFHDWSIRKKLDRKSVV